jgi:hypothetical protein
MVLCNKDIVHVVVLILRRCSKINVALWRFSTSRQKSVKKIGILPIFIENLKVKEIEGGLNNPLPVVFTRNLSRCEACLCGAL